MVNLTYLVWAIRTNYHWSSHHFAVTKTKREGEIYCTELRYPR